MEEMQQTLKLLQKGKENSAIIEQLEYRLNEALNKYEQHEKQMIDQFTKKLQVCLKTIDKQNPLMESQTIKDDIQLNLVDHSKRRIGRCKWMNRNCRRP